MTWRCEFHNPEPSDEFVELRREAWRRRMSWRDKHANSYSQTEEPPGFIVTPAQRDIVARESTNPKQLLGIPLIVADIGAFSGDAIDLRDYK